MSGHGNLIGEVLEYSVSKKWERAVLEWDIVGCDEDNDRVSTCICGKTGLKYLYTIKNKNNKKELYPIGSECICRFGRDDMNSLTKVMAEERKLYNAVVNNKSVKGMLSRKLIDYMYENGCFIPNKFNSYNPENDRKFFMEMFNKRTSRSEKQSQKLSILWKNYIVPYLKEKYSKTSGQ